MVDARKTCMFSSSGTSLTSIPFPGSSIYIICTHAKCWDGAAAAALLEMFCTVHGLRHVTVPHIQGKSYLREFGAYLQQRRQVTLLMFDVAPDEELVALVMSSTFINLVCGDHHIGTKYIMEQLEAVKSDRIMVRYDDTVSGAHLAWDWILLAMNGDVSTLGLYLDTECKQSSRLLRAICAADLFLHKGHAEYEAVDACLSMLHTPDAGTVRAMLSAPGKYEELVRDGALCLCIRANIAKDLLARGRTYRMTRRAMDAARAAGANLPEDCMVHYAHGIPHVKAEMGYLHDYAHLVFIVSVNVNSPKKWTLAIRRGRASDIRCDLVAEAFGGGKGHAAAAGTALDYDPIQLLQA